MAMRISRVFRKVSLGDVPSGVARRIPEPRRPMEHNPELLAAEGGPLAGSSVGKLLKPKAAIPSPGQAPRRYYVNTFSAAFFTELDKGVRSPWVVGAYIVVGGMATAKLIRLLRERGEAEAEMRQVMGRDEMPEFNVRFQPEHNMVVGIRSIGDRQLTRGLQNAAGVIDPEVDDSVSSRPPALIHAEKSEGLAGPDGSHPDIVVMEKTEFDKSKQRDYTYRFLQYIYNDDVSEARTDAKALKEADMDRIAFAKGKSDRLRQLSYEQRQQRAREDHLHASVKCRGVDVGNNCVPMHGAIEPEAARKLLVSLGPVHMLRDVRKLSHRWRFTADKEIDTNILLLGLRGGEVAAGLRPFANYKVDIVERDGSLVRLARSFLGFRELSDWSLSIAEPAAFVRRVAVDAKKRYDLIIVDALDGKGRLAADYGRLDFVDSIRNAMTNGGVAAVNIPNDDPAFFLKTVQNWRMGFEDKLLLLLHCATTNNSVLLAFQDRAERGAVTMGSCGSAHEFRDIINTFIRFYPNTHVGFDLTGEVSNANFVVLTPGLRYDPAQLLPKGHPALSNAANTQRLASSTAATGSSASPAQSAAPSRSWLGSIFASGNTR